MISPNDLLPHLQQLGKLGYWVVLLFAGGESLPAIGILLPGTVVVGLFGFFSAQGYLNVWWLFLFSTIGAFLGDAVSYWLGQKGTHFFKAENKILKLSHLDRGREFFQKHGNKSLFFGRFFGPVRSVIPFIAGLSHMHKKQFYIWNFSGAVVWSAAYLALGYFFGNVFQTIEVWSTRVGVILISLILLVVLIRFLAKRSKKFFGFLVSLFKSIFTAIITNPDISRVLQRHPKTVRFVQQRVDRKKFAGLPLTVIVLSFVYILSALFGVTESILRLEQFVAVDIRIEHLMALFRDPLFVRVFLWITVLGKWEVIFTAVVIATLIWWMQGRIPTVLGFFTSLGLTLGGGYLMKVLIARPRPLDAVYLETSASFPSAHAALSVGVYGFIAYGMIRQIKSWKVKANILFVALLLMVLIGLSRLYLGVHFVSDVWSGYLLGILSLLVGVGITEWLTETVGNRFSPFQWSAKLQWSVLSGLVTIEIIFASLFASFYQPILLISSNQQFTQQLQQPTDMFVHTSLPKYTDSIAGLTQEPISLLFVAPSEQALESDFIQAGWYMADTASSRSMWKLVVSALGKKAYPEAPVSPSFWNTQVQSVSFEQPTLVNQVTQRHHLRVWATPYEVDGQKVFVATASFDATTKWVVTHNIDPNIDGERAYVVDSLQATGVVASTQTVQLVDPVLGQNFAEEPFFTDGKAVVVYLHQ